jgi:NAD(P)-dependent dehydrogenase (short-subunit alcohol dehydrogenase family)
MDLGLNGLRVMVTAGASGIGRLIARSFLAEGASVHVSDADAKALEAFGAENPAAGRVHADVADRAQVKRLINDAVGFLGGLDCLVNNAGIAGPTGRVEEIDPDEWDRTLAVNVTGQFNCTRLAVPHLRQSKNPSIVNLSSMAGVRGFPMRSPYATSKWAVIGFTKTLAMELGRFGVRANAICPGSVAGPRIEAVFAGKARAKNLAVEEVMRQALEPTSLKRLIDPQDIANLCVFLASSRGANISGQALQVCGDTQYLP